jgi:hypothetical protein
MTITETYKGVSAFTITSLEDTEKVFAVKTPMTISLEDGSEAKMIEGRTEDGALTNVDLVPNITLKPRLMATYSVLNIGLEALSRGYFPISGAIDEIYLPRQFTVPPYITADFTMPGFKVATGSGHTKAAVPDLAIAEYVDGISVPITSGVTVNDNAEVIVTPAMAGKTITLKYLGGLDDATTIDYSSPIGFCSISIMVANSSNEGILINVPVAKVDPTGTVFDPNADNKQVSFMIVVGQGCQPYTIARTKLGAPCA